MKTVHTIACEICGGLVQIALYDDNAAWSVAKGCVNKGYADDPGSEHPVMFVGDEDLARALDERLAAKR